MKKLFRKGAAIILALGMCLTALTGCNSSKEAGEDGALTLFYSDLSGVNTAIKRKSDLYKKYMELCGVDFTCLIAGGGQADTKLQQYFNTGNLPDMFISRTAEKFGSQCVVCAIDAKRRPEGGWTVYLNGGRIDTGKDALLWAQEAERLGAGEILLTSMDCDGQKTGYDLELTRQVSERVGIPVIASGGAGKLEHFLKAFTEGRADAVLAASLFHFGEISIPQLKQYLRENQISVRI